MSNSANRVGVIGAGMTRFVRRAKEAPGELAAKAVEMALEDAGLTINDIDAVCHGTAPDAFDGVHMKGEHLIAGSGGVNKPYSRHFVGGGTGVFSPIHGWMHVASGKFKNCLIVAEEKMSPCVPHPAGAFLTIFDHTTEQPLNLTLLHIFAIEMCRFMHKYGYTEEELARVSVICKKNALGHPAAQIAKETNVEEVMNSPLLSWPVKRLDISPTSDGAVAIVLANEEITRKHCKAPAYIDGVGFRLDTAYWCTRDLAYPEYVANAAGDAYRMADLSNPEKEIDFWEPYDPFDYKALHHMNGLLQDPTGKRVKELLLSGAFEKDGSHPLCPSGGALGVGNPIAATGLMKIAELYFQLTGQAGARQLQKNVQRGIAQAWGDLMQVGTVVIMNADKGTVSTSNKWKEMKKEDLPGTALKSAKDVPFIDYQPDIRYSWDNGMALTTYLEGFKAGKIRGSRCPSCKRMMIPARAFCEECNLKEVNDYFDLPDTGIIKTFTLSNVDWDSSMLGDGKVNIFAVIEIDGTQENMGLVHRLMEVDPKDVKVGMRVKAVWKPEKERTGSITDLDHFRPLLDSDATDVKPVRVKPVELDSVTAKSFPGKIPLDYRYTAGVAGVKFYEDLAQGKLTGTECSCCNTVHIPPTAFCEKCMVSLDPDGKAKEIDPSKGKIVGFTVVTEDRSGEPLAKPEVMVQVGFEGGTGTIFGKLETEDLSKVKTGMGVALQASRECGPNHLIFR